MRPLLPEPSRLQHFFDVDRKEKARAIVGACLGLAFVGFLSAAFAHVWPNGLWMVAPVGASALLVFVTPASPLAQPWSVIAGNTLSALVGIGVASQVTELPLAAGLSVGLAIAVMFLGRCLHPPGGATALLAVLTHTVSLRFAFIPVLLNSLLLVGFAIAYNSLTGRTYPHRALKKRSEPSPSELQRSGLQSADLALAVKQYNQVLDVAPDDLAALLNQAVSSAYQRTMGQLVCADIMHSPAVTIFRGQRVDEAIDCMQSQRLKALPVLDSEGLLCGILTLADCLRDWRGRDLEHVHDRRVSHIMTRRVRVARADMKVTDLLPLFAAAGHHHLPVIGLPYFSC